MEETDEPSINPWVREIARQVTVIYGQTAYEPSIADLAKALGTTEEWAQKGLKAAHTVSRSGSTGRSARRRVS